MNKNYKMNNTEWRRLGRSVLLAALLLGASLPAMARDYVITWTNGGTTYYVGMNGNNIAVKTEFDITCVWSCRNGNNDANLGGTSYSLRNKNNTTYFLTTSCTRSGNNWTGYTYTWSALTVQNRASNIWRSSNGTNGNVYVRETSYTRQASVRVVNGAWAMYDNNTNGSQNSQVTTTTPGASSPTTAEIGTLTVTPIAAALYQGENEAFTASASVTVTNYSVPAHTKYTFTVGSTDYEYFYYNNTRYTSTDDFSTKTTTTQTPSYAWTKTGDDGSNASLSSTNAASTTVTHATQAAADKSVTLTVTASYSGAESKTANAKVVLYGPMVAPTITRLGNSISIATTNVNATIYYTTNGSTPTASSTPYTGSFDLTTSPTTVKAIAIRDGHSSTVTTETFNMQLPMPVISLTGAVATVTAGEGTPAGTKLYYTTDGTTPTASSTQITSGNTVTLTNPQIIQVIAVLTGYDNSEVAVADYIIEGISGSLVILDDRENHNWSYYSDATLPEMMRSLNPADVKITYYGDGIVMTGNADYTASSTDFVQPGNANYVGGAKVNVGGEDENTFIYFKTLERGDATQTAWTYSTDHSSAASRCPYTTIPNPFQVRPTYGNRTVNGTTTDANDFTGWRGFQCWRLKSVSGGAVYSAASGGTALSTGAIINGETQIYFAPNSEYGMEVQLEAVWARAYLIKGSNGNENSVLAQNVGVERNFMILTSNGQTYKFNGASGRRITNLTYPVTISCYYPSGEAPDYTNSTVRGNDNNITLLSATKFENVGFYNMGSYTLSADGKDLIIGRGCTGTVNNLYGLNAASTSSFKMRIESGTYNNLYFLGRSLDFTNDAKLTTIMGSDYDRAKVKGGDATYNEKLRVTADIGLGYNSTAGNTNNKGAEIFHCTVKSGNFDLGTAKYAGSEQFYISVWGNDPRTYGKRTLIVEGGIFSDIAGGMEQSTATQNVLMVDIRIKGGTVNSVVYGAAQKSGALGHRRMIITGGLIKGWIAGGANGNSNDANSTGEMVGNTYIYVGGNTEVNSNNSTTTLNRAVGGNVFAAGCGWGSSSNSGLVTGNTNVAIADEAYVERGVYGGGSYGYTTQTANIYILGGTIDGKNGGVTGTDYLAAIDGGVYGGACQNQGGTVNLTMSGGTVNGSVYGGSNYTGTLSGTSTVTLNGGTINGSIYGGGNGEGNPTNVTGAVQVTVNGGTVTGAVYGCGNVSGAPQSTVNVDVYGTDPQPGSGYAINQVFGGGNAANYSGTPVVTVHDDNSCDISIGEVYGGGNAATVTGTDVTIEAGNRIGNVYGGCYGANVTTNGTKVNIKGGTIEHVYGGNNYRGTITGAIRVRAHKDSDCPMKIGELYGGGNEAASNVGSIDIGCTGTYVESAGGHADCNETDNRIGYELEGIHEVYGGANQANITGDISLTIDSGMVYRVFGGNNNSGSISGTITVNIQKTDPNTCGWYVGYVYGGGFNAPYSKEGTANNPSVNVTNGLVSHSVFGGGKGNSAVVTGNPLVTLSNKAHVGENVYGGGDAAPVTGNTSVILKN